MKDKLILWRRVFVWTCSTTSPWKYEFEIGLTISPPSGALFSGHIYLGKFGGGFHVYKNKQESFED